MHNPISIAIRFEQPDGAAGLARPPDFELGRMELLLEIEV